jgi:hypothetical protein
VLGQCPAVSHGPPAYVVERYRTVNPPESFQKPL